MGKLIKSRVLRGGAGPQGVRVRMGQGNFLRHGGRREWDKTKPCRMETKIPSFGHALPRPIPIPSLEQYSTATGKTKMERDNTCEPKASFYCY